MTGIVASNKNQEAFMNIQSLNSFAAPVRRLRQAASTLSLSHSWNRDTSGNVAMIFAMLLVPTTAIVGMGVDFGRVYTQRAKVQEVADASVLKAAKQFQTTGNAAAAMQSARAFFKANLPEGINAELTNADVTFEGKGVVAAKLSVKTTFMKLLGENAIEANVRAEASVPTEPKDIEMAIVFDVTGSMGDQAGKMESAKLGAKDAINTMMPAAPHPNRIRMSLVPFSEHVNIGDFSGAATGSPATAPYDYWYQRKTTCRSYDSRRRCEEWNYEWVSEVRTKYRTNCMAERMQATTGHAYDDAVPGTASTNFWTFWTTNSSGQDSSCVPAARMIPLTDNRDALLDAVDDLVPTGGTAGQIGTAWGWYTVSPNWSSFWPAESAPEVRDDAKRLKAVVIMTDGDYNFQYRSDYTGTSGNQNVGNGRSSDQSLQVCAAMKAQGIEVFTIGYKLPGTDPNTSQRRLLRTCASSPNQFFEEHFYDAKTNAEIRTAFRNIATRVSAASGSGEYAVKLTK
jgi:Flp pilus assembly protein TadG